MMVDLFMQCSVKLVYQLRIIEVESPILQWGNFTGRLGE